MVRTVSGLISSTSSGARLTGLRGRSLTRCATALSTPASESTARYVSGRQNAAACATPPAASSRASVRRSNVSAVAVRESPAQRVARSKSLGIMRFTSQLAVSMPMRLLSLRCSTWSGRQATAATNRTKKVQPDITVRLATSSFKANFGNILFNSKSDS